MLDTSLVDRNPVAAVANWRTRIRSEHDSAKNWGCEWGFLVRNREQDPASLSHCAAASIGIPQGTIRSTVAANLKDEVLETIRKNARKDTMDLFMDNYIKSNSKTRPLPYEEFARPMLTSHAYGWGKNLEARPRPEAFPVFSGIFMCTWA